ncbi:MBL fold metallo-hydrolase [Amycolatopsis sp. CA-230715]|uniref:MBL fold metallo-hydrolase n=1 Tax=Amycolatopsis sp. CA-230715 TaxID=2745196 RepID=UPI001C030529|nr:MBL fold metallo-hydrolase [Amycolatopsis sp. CA-230715]QWF81743.1 putative metallo-hydrolase [Amycolatopsis sp. CA-230715]
MRVHHLNLGTLRPLGGRLIDGQGGYLHRAELVCHALLIETGSGLVLVDTGFGHRAITRPRDWLGSGFIALTGARPRGEETALAQVKALGFAPEDVRDIVLTHLDLDHAGGLADFPEATVHVYEREHQALTRPRNRVERTRYRQIQFQHGPRWQTYGEHGENWFGFDAVRELKGLPPEILLVPLSGHTAGHTGVAVDTGDGWLLHAGDAYFFHGQLSPFDPHCTPGLATFQVLVQTISAERKENLRRLRALAAEHRDDIRIFSAHSPDELRLLRRG